MKRINVTATTDTCTVTFVIVVTLAAHSILILFPIKFIMSNKYIKSQTILKSFFETVSAFVAEIVSTNLNCY